VPEIVDASGLTVSKKGDYIEEKWIRKKKEFVKLHIAVDAKSKKVVSFRITKGNVHDTRKFCPLVREAAAITKRSKPTTLVYRKTDIIGSETNCKISKDVGKLQCSS
jgi:DDE family transposase